MSPSSRAPLTFALVTDVHFGPEGRFDGKLRKLTARAPELLRAFAARMRNEVKPDFVVNLGDDVEDESRELDLERYRACQAILRESGREVVNVAGNHDTALLEPADLLEAWGRPEGSALHYAIVRGGVRFLVLHSVERKDLDVSVGPEQLAWVEAELAASAEPVVVLMHHSAADQDLEGNRWFEGSPHICLLRERRALRRLFRESGKVLAVFNGHLHWNHLAVHDGIPYVTLQSLIENLDEDAPGRPAAAHAVVRIDERKVLVHVEGAERGRYQFARRGTP